MTFYSNDLGIETVWNCLESGLKRGSIKKITDRGEACPMMEWCFKFFTDPREAFPMMEWFFFLNITDNGEAFPMMEWCFKKLQ